jgi:predicted ATP-dependent endonuclease of OLD family
MYLNAVKINEFKGLRELKVSGCGQINALVGKNNSGKSSILHAIDFAGLALSVNNWNHFQPKLEIKDLINDAGRFSIELEYPSGDKVTVSSNPNHAPIKEPNPTEGQIFKSILVWPDVSAGMKQRRHKTPKQIHQQVENRNFGEVDSLEILYAIKFYGERYEKGLSPEDYHALLDEIKRYFPDIEKVESDRTEEDIATLKYQEYNKTLDILYSGSGLKHFVDILVKTTISGAQVVLLDEPEMGLHPDLQRQFIEYLHRLAENQNIQIFMATHSHVLLNYADTITYYRVFNARGERQVLPVPSDGIHELLGDLGLRPSDVFNQDLCLMVEGATEVVFFEHILRVLYREEFENIAVGILQYGGSSADGIIKGDIGVSNIAPAQPYTFWIRDRDAPPTEPPSSASTKFSNALKRNNLSCHILKKREIEFYFPKEVLEAAQNRDPSKVASVMAILNGSQEDKFRELASADGVCVPSGKHLRALLRDYLTEKSQLDTEIREIIEGTLLSWKDELLGSNRSG